MSGSTYGSSTVVGIAVVFIIIGAGLGFGASWMLAPAPGPGPGPVAETLKAGFIYVGPIGDYGWSHAHEQGRLFVNSTYDWLDTVYLESVPEDQTENRIDYLVNEQGCDVIFTTSFGFMDGTIAAAANHPNTIFFHCSGYKRAANVGTYFADFYQLYYLNGLMAGALTMTGKIGYVAAFPIPELIRHINAFQLGAQEANASVQTEVRWLLTDWYDPIAARSAAEALITAGCDVLAFTEDSPTVLEVAEENPGVLAFSHYSPMQYFANDSCISGQLADWGVIYEDILQKIYLGQYTSTNLQNVDYLWLLKEGGIELGGLFDEPINTVFVDDLQGINVTDPILGEISIYDLVFKRYEQMSDVNVVFEPFTGPIYNQTDYLMVPDGVRMTTPQLLTMDWFVKGVIGDASP
ncbi:MAG: BMP family ABC transporter substrate-binding protein [Candidatus Thorarchaeota archaeon]